MFVIAGITALLTAVMVYRAFVHERALTSAPSRDAETFANRIARVAPDGRIAAALTHSGPGSWERRVADAAALPSRVDRRDALSDAVDEVANVLDGGAHWPSALLRIQALVAGFLTLTAVFLRGPVDAAAAFGAGLVGLGILAAKRHRALAISKSQRALADRVLTLVDPDQVEVLGPRATRGRARP